MVSMQRNRYQKRVPRAVRLGALILAIGAAAAVIMGALGAVPGWADGPLTVDDGLIPSSEEGLTVDADIAAMTRLDPPLRAAMRAATADAALEGLTLNITSGWRSIRYQAQLFDDAVATYGSEEVALEFVATPELSSHTTGRAVDVGSLDAQLWLMEHGYRYGLCQSYANERWHFELATTPGGICPVMLPDASYLGR